MTTGNLPWRPRCCIRRRAPSRPLQNDFHRGEHEAVARAPYPDVDHTAGHGERHRVGDLVDEQVEADIGHRPVDAGPEDVGGVVAQRVRVLVAVLGQPRQSLGATVQLGLEQILERACTGFGTAQVLHLVTDSKRQLVELALVVVVPEPGDELLNFGQRDIGAHGWSQPPKCAPRHGCARSVEHVLTFAELRPQLAF
jgi:hypothetical protein